MDVVCFLWESKSGEESEHWQKFLDDAFLYVIVLKKNQTQPTKTAPNILFLVFTALSIQPNDALMYKFRADIRGKLGFNKEAVEDYKQAISIQEQIDSMWKDTSSHTTWVLFTDFWPLIKRQIFNFSFLYILHTFYSPK